MPWLPLPSPCPPLVATKAMAVVKTTMVEKVPATPTRLQFAAMVFWEAYSAILVSSETAAAAAHIAVIRTQNR